MTPGIALGAVDAGLANRPRQGRDLRRDREPETPAPDYAARPANAPPATQPGLTTPQTAPLAAFAAGLISRQSPPRDALFDRQRLLEAEHALPERSELPLTDRFV